MVIRNLVFDLGGVIVDLDPSATVSAFARLGLDVDSAKGVELMADLERGRIGEDEFLDRLSRECGAGGQALREAWCAMLRGVPRRRLEALRRLSHTYHISLLSNTNDIHWTYCLEKFFRPQGFDPEGVFDYVFLSQRLHLAKPDETLFRRVLLESGYKAEETLFVDDSPVNCEAFASLGVRTLTPREADDWVPKVATIGFFDGVHRGHQCLIRQVAAEASRRNLMSTVITFDQHPRSVLSADYQPALLTTLDERRSLLAKTEADTVSVLPFTRELSLLSAREFMGRVLRQRLGVEVLVMGYDHRFGHGGGTREDYVRWGRETGIEVVFAEELPGGKTSSSVVRKALSEGDVERAALLLGHSYTLSGRVVAGRGVGHTLGFPTANLSVSKDKLTPARGVYAVGVEMPDGTSCRGMLNIGQRPTLHNGTDTTYEVHILGFSGDLYGQPLTLKLESRLRGEKCFPSLEALKRQLRRDAEQCQ